MSYLSWFGIFRLGLIQTSLGAIVVLTTSTLNRIMVVEYALPAMLPGALVGIHYAIQMTRPRFGYGSDVGGRRTPWIIGGMGTLAFGGTLAAFGTLLMQNNTSLGILISLIAFLLIGMGVGASGTSLLVLLAKQVEAKRRAAAASIVWFMMIMGFALTAGLAGHFLEPFSTQRLLMVSMSVSICAFTLTLVALYKLENSSNSYSDAKDKKNKPPFLLALKQVWVEPEARRFTIFIFISMLAYSAQDLILEPYAGIAFKMTPGESTQLAGLQHSGVLVGMILVAVACTWLRKYHFGSLKNWTVGGCIASAFVLFILASGGYTGEGWPIHLVVFSLGVTTGTFAVAAIGSMMTLVGKGREQREGIRMGLWGAAQAIAFGLGGFIGTVAVDFARHTLDSPITAYAIVFCCEGVLFLIAAAVASTINITRNNKSESSTFTPITDSSVIEVIHGR